MTYRILSLDGGGSWALIQVRALIAIYGAKRTGHKVLQEFDLVAANSGGSIVLGGLLENLTLADLLEYFENETKRRSIFSPTKFWGDRAIHDLTGLGPKYSAEGKLPGLQALIPSRGNLPLTVAAANIRRTGTAEDVRLLIIGFDYDRNRATFFRSKQSGTGWGKGAAAGVTLAEAIHASTNAPVNYFDGPAQFPDQPGLRYWDGAIAGYNNPILAAVVEALMLGKQAKDIVALSLGTGNTCLPAPDSGNLPYVRKLEAPSLTNDLRKLAKSIMDDPPDAATFMAHVITSGSDGLKPPVTSRIVRMNPLISPVKNNAGQWVAPDGMTAAQFSFLVGLDMDAIQQHEIEAIGTFSDLWLNGKILNQAIRMNWDTLDCEIGYRTYQEAKTAWDAVQ